MPHASDPLPLDPGEKLLLSVLRYIGAAYETGDAACWEAAHDAAETVEGILDGPLLVARATALIRLVRRGRRDIKLMPPSSRWLSSDEESLMTLVRRARGSEAFGWATGFDPTKAGAERLVVVAGALTTGGGSSAAARVHPKARCDATAPVPPSPWQNVLQ